MHALGSTHAHQLASMYVSDRSCIGRVCISGLQLQCANRGSIEARCRPAVGCQCAGMLDIRTQTSGCSASMYCRGWHATWCSGNVRTFWPCLLIGPCFPVIIRQHGSPQSLVRCVFLLCYQGPPRSRATPCNRLRQRVSYRRPPSLRASAGARPNLAGRLQSDRPRLPASPLPRPPAQTTASSSRAVFHQPDLPSVHACAP